MDDLAKARIAQRDDEPIKAAEYYAAYFKEHDGHPADLIDAAFLLFECQDYGFAYSHKLPMEFVNTTWDPMWLYLDRAEQFAEGRLEAGFWKMYFRLILLPENDDEIYKEYDQRSLEYLSQGVKEASIMVRHFDPDYAASALQKLIDSLTNVETEKARYIRSIL